MINDKLLRKRLKALSSKMPGQLQAGLVDGMRLFEGRITEQQMSGRKGDKFLNTQTGNLRWSWHVSSKSHGLNYVVTLGIAVKYAAIHQYGGTIEPKTAQALRFRTMDGHWVTTRKVTIPKRLYILEDFQKNGRVILRRAVLKRISKAIHKGIA